MKVVEAKEKLGGTKQNRNRRKSPKAKTTSSTRLLPSLLPSSSSTEPSPSSRQRSSVPPYFCSDEAADHAEAAAAADSAGDLRECSSLGVQRDVLPALLHQRTEEVEDLRSSEDILPAEVDSSVERVPAADTVQEDQEEVERGAAADLGGWDD